MSDLLVMKFGGTSMGSSGRIRIAAEICTSAKKNRPVFGSGFGDDQDH